MFYDDEDDTAVDGGAATAPVPDGTDKDEEKDGEVVDGTM